MSGAALTEALGILTSCVQVFFEQIAWNCLPRYIQFKIITGRYSNVMLKELAETEGVPYPTLARWIQRGLVKPRSRTGKSGSAVVLDKKNVVELKNLIRLRNGGLSLQRARHLMEDVRAAGYNPLSQGVFVVLDRQEGRVLRISEKREHAREVMRPDTDQYTMVILNP